jgi:hypothetical protein
MSIEQSTAESTGSFGTAYERNAFVRWNARVRVALRLFEAHPVLQYLLGVPGNRNWVYNKIHPAIDNIGDTACTKSMLIINEPFFDMSDFGSLATPAHTNCLNTSPILTHCFLV